VWNCGDSPAYYVHDGNKNVSEVVAENGALAAHYEYAPFGAVIAQRGASAAANPWRFSSEYAEDDTATVYYNYRHYEAAMGRWMSRDPIMYGKNIYGMVDNNIQLVTDSLGLEFTVTNHVAGESPPNGWRYGKVHATALTLMTNLVDISIVPTTVGCAQRCYKFAVVFPMIQVDIYYKDEYHRIQSYPDEMEHVQCFRKWHDKLTEIANTAKGMSCMSPEAANSAIEGFIKDADSAAEECKKCNAELDKEGGPHGH
jgi:RHS repeat-associated protein